MSMLIDFNQTVIAVTSQVQKNLPRNDHTVDSVRGYFINSLRYYREQFSHEYGDVVLCCDSRPSWRVDVFPYYKQHRSKQRQESPINWDLVHEALDQLSDEIDQYFPYKVVKVNRAEGDDIIATLCKHDPDGAPNLILSSDNDFRQLQYLSNVYQWSYRTAEWIVEKDPEYYREHKIVKGDPKDGVPNIRSDDDTFITDKRQTPLNAKKVDALMEGARSNTLNEQELRNWQRNKKMLDLVHEIPDWLQQAILDKYHEAYVAPRDRLLTYFMKYGLKTLTDSIQIF